MTRNEQLLCECQRFTRYLIRQDPSTYVVLKYAQAHEAGPLGTQGDGFDRRIVRLAARYRLLTGPAAAYIRLFGPQRVLQEKLVLLLAVLETCAPSYRRLEPAAAQRVPLLLARLLGRFCLAMLYLAAGMVVFAPLHVVLRGRPQGGE